MTTVARAIRQHREEILAAWTQEASLAASARGLSGPAISNLMPTYLTALAEAGDDLGTYSERRRLPVESHLATRLRQGFDLPEIVHEFALLGRCIARSWTDLPAAAQPSLEEVERLFREVHLASAAVADMFTRHMIEDEQAEKRFGRLLQDLAGDALRDDTQPLRERLKEVLELVLEAMQARSAALLLYGAEDATLVRVAGVGAAVEKLEEFAKAIDPASFAGRVAASESATAVLDAETTELTVSETLRRSGIHSLLGIRLPPRRTLVGVLYVGIGEQRPFSAREVRRLESLGERLTIHLENAGLYADLQEKLAALKTERELRERFVAVLAHDLRGPLTAARLSAQQLAQRPEQLDERRELAVRIQRNIDRTDRMVHDLLDANRLRAGERLPLRLAECDLGDLARDVVRELAADEGDRFVVRAEAGVRGTWSVDELRRALWNLLTNAVKYGAADRPVTVSVARVGEHARLAVHNEGAAIPAEEQDDLFRPFSRTATAQAGGRVGWGLGLTLVRGCAEAHGGSVRVESAPGEGTTFTVEIPMDARPVQARG